jgi:hypothetical protein
MIEIEKLVGKVFDKIEKGSTRLVYFPIQKKKIILDGIETEIKTALKVAKPHKYEIESGECTLGKFQNKVESSLMNSDYNAFILNCDNTYTTNYNGILCPVISHDPNFYWEEMFYVYPMTVRDFCIETTTDEYPAGLYFPDVHSCMENYFAECNKKPGEIWPEYIEEHKYNLIMKHPLIKTYISLAKHIKLMTVDFTLKNLGYIEHPFSKKKTIVLCDYGCTLDYVEIL